MRLALAAAAAAALVAGVVLLRRRQAEQDYQPDPEPASDGEFSIQDLMPWSADEMPDLTAQTKARNVAAFLHMIRSAEGTAKAGGYGALFGWPMAGRSFNPDTATGHPRQFFDYTDKAGKTIRTSAAGAYQITWTTWAGYAIPFRAWTATTGRQAPGFTPAAQDAFAEFLLKLDGALDDVEAGRFDEALAIARRRWASLPGAGYNQPERSRAFVLAAYQQAGGTLA